MRSKNRIRSLYKGYDKALKPFKTEMVHAMKNDRALAMAICETWRAEQYSSQYWKTTAYFGRNHKKAFNGFCATELPGKVLTGRDEFWLTLRFCGYESIYEKYKKLIPERKAFGIIFGDAMDIVNNKVKNEQIYDKHVYRYQVTYQKVDRIKKDETYMHYYDDEKRARDCADLLKLDLENENIKIWEVIESRRRI